MAEKIKLNLEYVLNSSPRILFPYLQEPNELAQWFADDVNYHDGIYEFIWDNESHRAKLIATKENNPLKCSKTSEGWCKEQMQESLEESIWIQELNDNTNPTLGISPFSKKESYMISILCPS